MSLALAAWDAPARGWVKVTLGELGAAAAAAGESVLGVATLAVERVAEQVRRTRPTDVVGPGGCVTDRWVPFGAIGVRGDDPSTLLAWAAAARALGVGRVVALLPALDPPRAAACVAAGVDDVWCGLTPLDPDTVPAAGLEWVGPDPRAEQAAVVAGGDADVWRTAATLVALAAQGDHVELHTSSRHLHQDLRATLAHVLVSVIDPALDARVARIALKLHPTVEGCIAAVVRSGASLVHLIGTGDARLPPGVAARCVEGAGVPGMELVSGALAPDPRALLRRERTVAPDAEWVRREAGAAAIWADAVGLAVEPRLLSAAARDAYGPPRPAAAALLPTGTRGPTGPHRSVHAAAEARGLYTRVLTAARRKLPDDVHRLTADRLGVAADHVLVVRSRSAVWQAILGVLVAPGSAVAVSATEGPEILRACGAVGAHVRPIGTPPDAPLELGVESTLAAARTASAVALSSPGLETGRGLHPGLVRMLTLRSDAVVIVDEALGEVAGQDLRVLFGGERLCLIRPLAYGLARAGLDAQVLLGPPALVAAVAARLGDPPDPLTRAAVALLDREPDAADAALHEAIDARAALAYALGEAGARVLDGEGDFVLVDPEAGPAELAALVRGGAGGRVRPGPAGTVRFELG